MHSIVVSPWFLVGAVLHDGSKLKIVMKASKLRTWQNEKPADTSSIVRRIGTVVCTSIVETFV
jgi:hypothetical protein